jgi:hypothetical protein
MNIERRDDDMETRIGIGGSPVLDVYRSEGTAPRPVIDERIARLQAEAATERLAGPREGLRQHVGHALMALGRTIHGLEPEQPVRPALDTW